MISPVDPKDKIIDEAQIKSAKYLYVHGVFSDNDFISDSKLFKVISKTKKSLIVETDKPEEAKEYLIHINEVEYVSKYTDPTAANNMISGHSQQNTNITTTDSNGNPSMNRYLEAKGINGKDQVVAFIDTDIDYNNAMFNDPNTALTFNQIITNHRKFVYFYNEFGSESNYYQQMEPASHGTHVAGTIAGKAQDPKSKISSFNGIAPEAKLMYLGRFSNTNNEHLTNSDNLNQRLLDGKAIAYSNSWGSIGYELGLIRTSAYDEFVSNYPSGESCLFIFAAGNEAQSVPYYSLRGPSYGKNILCVAAADSVYRFENFKIYISYNSKKVEIYPTSQPVSPSYVLEIPETIYLSKIDDTSSPMGTIKIIYIDAKLIQSLQSNYNEIILAIAGQIEKYSIAAIIFDMPQSSIEGLESLFQTLPFPPLITNQNGGISSFVGNTCKIDMNIGNRVGILYPEKASFSSVGPSPHGLIKPDLMAPGSYVISANSKTTVEKGHGTDDSKMLDSLALKSGTSMATPNVAGASALIAQYLTDGHYLEKVEIHSLLLRALLLLSTSKKDGSSTPDCYVGHGQIDISTILPFENSNFGLRFSKMSIMQKGQTHHIGYITVTSNKSPLKIVLTSMDIPLSVDSFIPIYYDLDLIVVSPEKKVYVGNNRSLDTEHLSMNEKVIIPESEVVNGKYEIHVISNLNIEEDNGVHYVVSSVGPFEQSNTETNPKYIEMKNTNDCVPSTTNNTKCENGRLKCPENYTGQLCQQQFDTLLYYSENNNPEFHLQPNTIQYFKVPPIEEFDNLIVAMISTNAQNNQSMLWEMDSAESYIPALASNNLYVPIFNYESFGAQPMTLYTFDMTKEFLTLNAKQNNYFMIINNFPLTTNFIAYVINKPHDNQPICFCTDRKCSNATTCENQNIYDDVSAMFGLVHYVNDRVTYLDHNTTFPAIFLSFTNVTFELLNKNGPKYTIELIYTTKYKLHQKGMRLTAKDLTIQIEENPSETDPSVSQLIEFDYINFTNVDFKPNDYKFFIKELITDYESYDQSLNTTNILMIDAKNPLQAIEVYNNVIIFFDREGLAKRIYFNNNMKIVFLTNRPQGFKLTVVKGEKGDLNLPAGLTIRIIPTNSDGSNIIVDDELKDVIMIGEEEVGGNGLSDGEIAAIVICCVAFVVIVVVVIIIVIKKKKSSSSSSSKDSKP
ncbi:Clan SB, family S8, subtilisin-like serine peptidase [Histomonas meleagridis]|uniref:Clan SB, family S8, subtilisin-like serine peptidase n=1 Tax=Histomonas meleagridis TaxID=135588 RepID=UPI003559DC0A|nr:Clan SB, family S8, subtilisin-like serine peptidase [Histomonas meleagridis]KAH0805949.1 Clan SB, family S8, subtilisin-like serine peptidase [Histomonas meleagridis]